MKRILAAAMTVAATGFLAGCGGPETTQPFPRVAQGEVVLRQNVQFEDVPVPRNFRLDRTRSHSFESSRFREGEFRYEGPESVVNAVAFYRGEMELDGWRLVDETIRSGRATLVFAKGAERAEVFLEEKPYLTQLEIRVGPVNAGPVLETLPAAAAM